MRPGKNGGQLRNGNPGNKGGGRKPGEFQALCRELASCDDTIAVVRRVIKGELDPKVIAAVKWASEHGYGKPAQAVDVTSGGERLSYVIESPAKAPNGTAWAAAHKR